MNTRYVSLVNVGHFSHILIQFRMFNKDSSYIPKSPCDMAYGSPSASVAPRHVHNMDIKVICICHAEQISPILVGLASLLHSLLGKHIFLGYDVECPWAPPIHDCMTIQLGQ